MIVLGIDPGSRRCGYGAVSQEGSRFEKIESGVLAPGDNLPMAERLAAIWSGLESVIRRAGAAEIAVESVFAGISVRSAIALGQARGVVLAAAAHAGLPIFEYAPAQIKLAVTGSGRAEKNQMVSMANVILRADVSKVDEADALAIAICHLTQRRARARIAAR